MIPYFTLIMLPILVAFIGQKYRINIGKRTIFQTQSASLDVFMCIFFMLLALRGLECGSDTKQYLVLYEKYSSGGIVTLLTNYDHEFGYKLLNKFIGETVDNYQFLLVITSVVCVCPIWYFYKRESENVLLTIVLFLTVAPFVLYFSGIRQAMAMSFSIPVWYATKKKKWLQVIGFVFLAMQFHTSAFILLLIYPLYYAKITKRWLLIVIPAMLVIYTYKGPIFNFLVTFLWQEYGLSSETGATTVLILLALFGIYSYMIPCEKTLDDDCMAMRNILLLSIVVQCFAPVHPLAMRMNYYFLIFIPILMTKIPNRSKKEFSSIARLSVIVMIVFFAYYFFDTVVSDDDPLNIIPYIPFWRN